MNGGNGAANIVAFPIKPDVESLLPVLQQIPDGSEELVAIVMQAGRWLDGLQGMGANPAAAKKAANALFMAYWASARLLGMLPDFDEQEDAAG